jgi:hypothetical protein
VYEEPVIDIDMLHLLLSQGANPNEKISIHGGQAIWCLFLISCFQNEAVVSQQVNDAWYKATELLIAYGADPHFRIDLEMLCGGGEDSHTVKLPIRTIMLAVYDGDNASSLLTQLLGVKQRQQIF